MAYLASRLITFTEEEADILEHLDKQSNKSKYAKSLIKQDMHKGSDTVVDQAVAKIMSLLQSGQIPVAQIPNTTESIQEFDLGELALLAQGGAVSA